MIDPPAAAHVASSTSDGIACPAIWSQGCGRMPDPAEHGVEHARRGRRCRRTSTAARDDRRDHDREVGERGVQPLAAPDLAHEHRHEQREREAEQQREEREVEWCCVTALPSAGSVSTRAKLSKPTQTETIQVGLLQAHDADCTIGDHEKKKKTKIIGSRNSRCQAAARDPGEPAGARAAPLAARAPASVGRSSHAFRSLCSVARVGVEDAALGAVWGVGTGLGCRAGDRPAASVAASSFSWPAVWAARGGRRCRRSRRSARSGRRRRGAHRCPACSSSARTSGWSQIASVNGVIWSAAR